MKRHVMLATFVLLVAIIGSGCGSQPVTSGQAPDFTLDSLNGGAVTLSSLKGQIVVLDFWAIWCSPCIEAMPHLQELHERYADQGVVILAINVGDERDEIVEFMAEFGYPFTVLLDADSTVTEAYGVQGIPHTVIVNQEGEIHDVPIWADEVENTLHQLLEE